MSSDQKQWLRFLRGSCLFILITGLLPSLAVFEVTQEPWRLFFDVLTWPFNGEPQSLTTGERQLSAILGGVLCGWSLLMYRLADEKIFNPSIHRAMVQSAWTWFVLDSLGSVLAGLPLNAFTNIGFLLLLVVPLHRLRTV